MHPDGEGSPDGVGWRRALAAAARAPFTTIVGLAILLIAFANGSALGSLNPAVSRDWGFDPLRFWQGPWYTLVTNTLFVRNAPMLVGVLALLIAALGVYETRFGTARAVSLFVLANVWTLLLTSGLLVYPLHASGAPVQTGWAPPGDVGASFGGFACLGAWMARPPARLRWILAITLGLLVKSIVYPEPFGDLGHLIAFFSGPVLDRVLPRGYHRRAT